RLAPPLERQPLRDFRIATGHLASSVSLSGSRNHLLDFGPVPHPCRFRPALLGIACIASLAASAAGQQAPTDLRALYHSLEAPRPDAVAAAPEPLDLGRTPLRPAAGTKLYRMVADGRPCGVLFDGDVSWAHRVDDPVTQPVARRLVEKISRLAMSQE